VALKIEWGSEQVVYQTNGYGGSDSDISGTTGADSDAVDLATNGYHGAMVIIKATFPSSPTDNLNFSTKYYNSSTFDGDEEEQQPAGQIEKKDGGERIYTYFVGLCQYFKVHLEASGSTDSIDVEVRVTPYRLTV